MRKVRICGLVVLIAMLASLAGAVRGLRAQLKAAKAEKELYRRNTSVLLGKVEAYEVNDSLNAVSMGRLELKLCEYKEYRAKDMALINSLLVDNRRLEQISTAQMQSIYALRGQARDTVVYEVAETRQADTLRCLNIADKWFELHGCMNAKGEFAGSFESRDSLVYVEHIVPKRFLFIRWGVKERRQEIVSKNPHTRIVGAEFVRIRR
jgi:hypothetical protein